MDWLGPLYDALREFRSRCRIAVGRARRAREGAEGIGAPQATEPGSGAEPRSNWFKRTNRHDGRRLREWRSTWAAVVEAPTRVAAEALRARLVEIGLDDDEHEIELEMLEGLESLIELTEAIGTGAPPAITTGHRAVGTDPCYFSVPASLPDDPAQPSGTLLLTSTRAIFLGGGKAVTIPWHRVGVCARQDRDVLLVRTDREDLHRVRCNTYGDALHAAFLVRHLTARRRV